MKTTFPVIRSDYNNGGFRSGNGSIEAEMLSTVMDAYEAMKEGTAAPSLHNRKQSAQQTPFLPGEVLYEA